MYIQQMRAAVNLTFLAILSFASLAQTTPGPSTFDVASVKPSRITVGRDANNRFRFDASGIRGKNVTLKYLIVEAYDLQQYRVFGGPKWLDESEYDIDASAGKLATREQLRLMLRALLRERFHLTAHSELKELRVYELVVEKNGPKIHLLADSGISAENTSAAGAASFHGDLRQFANFLSVQLTIPTLDDPEKPGIASGAPVPVIDATGLAGVYDIEVMKPELGTDMFTLWQRVLEDQLGLKLESRKSKVKILIVDGAERVPTPN